MYLSSIIGQFGQFGQLCSSRQQGPGYRGPAARYSDGQGRRRHDHNGQYNGLHGQAGGYMALGYSQGDQAEDMEVIPNKEAL